MMIANMWMLSAVLLARCCMTVLSNESPVVILPGLMFVELPGIKMRVTQNGLNYAGQQAVNIISRTVTGATIPDQSGSSNKWYGKTSYGSSNTKVTRFQPPTPSVTSSSGALTVSLSNAAVSVSGNWRYSYKVLFWTVRDSGSFSASASGISLSVSVAMGKTSTGQPTVYTTACSCTIRSVSVSTGGSWASWFYNLFTGFIENTIKNAVRPKICDAINKAININGAAQLSTMQLILPVFNDWQLDCSLQSKPTIGSGYIETSHNGLFTYRWNPVNALPFQATYFSTFSSSSMLMVWVSEYTINTIGYAVYNRNTLSYSTTLPQLPIISTLFPGATIRVQLNATSAPTIIISTFAATGTFNGRAVLSARFSNNTELPVATLSITASVSVSPSFNGTHLMALAANSGVTATLVSSSVGAIDNSALSTWANYLMSSIVIPKLNEVGRRGLQLPNLKYVNYQTSTVQLGTGAVLLSTDIRY